MITQGLRTVSPLGNNDYFAVFTYNTCSLLAEGRLELLLEELEGQQWDVIVVQETHREARRETIYLDNGHI